MFSEESSIFLRMADPSDYSSLFPKLRVRDITGIKVKVLVDTGRDGDREFEILSLPPDSNEEDVSDAVGDGLFKLEAFGLATDHRPPAVLEVRELSLAVGREAIWKDRVRSVLSGINDEPSPMPGRGRPSHLDRPSLRRFEDDPEEGGDGLPPDPAGSPMGPPYPRTMPMMGGMGMGGLCMGSGDPIIVPLGPDENLPLARGLSPEEQQKRMDEARLDRRSRIEEQEMTKQMMDFLASNSRAAEERAARAEKQNNDLLMMMLKGKSESHAEPSLSPSASEYKEMLEERRAHVRELEDRLAQSRRDADERERFWREHAAALERKIWEKDGEIARLQGDVKMKEIQAEISKMAAAGGIDPQKSSGMSTEDKIKLAMTALQSAGPLLEPILRQLGVPVPGGQGLPPGAGGGGGGGDLPGM